jgi:hypothetical protein
MNNHEKFGVMSVLAATGQLDTTEREEWNLHIENCDKCRNLTRDFVQIGAQALLPHGDKYKRVKVDRKMTARFVERARKEGVVLQSPPQSFKNPAKNGRLGWELAPVVLLIPAILAGVLAFDHWHQSTSRSPISSRLESPVPLPVPRSVLSAKSTTTPGSRVARRVGSMSRLGQPKPSRFAVERPLMSSLHYPASVSLNISSYQATFNRTSPFVQSGTWPSISAYKALVPSQKAPMMMAAASFSILPLRWGSRGKDRSRWDSSRSLPMPDYFSKMQAVNHRHINWRQLQQEAPQPRFASDMVWPEPAATRERP